MPGASVPLAGYGSSDCDCETHLFFFEKRWSNSSVFHLINITNEARQNTRHGGAQMFRFVTSLFGYAHRHCTFPITAKNPGTLTGRE
jgi:hypothetical protein